VMSIVIDWNRVLRKQSQNLQIQVKKNKLEVLP
jgi:hypothetical protein